MSDLNKDYYLGLDIGTNSVGWTVTDEHYNLLKINKKSAWGVRIFDEAKTAAERRLYRSSRRRLQRTRQRIVWLNELFHDELAQKDTNFIKRLQESKIKENYKQRDKNKKYNSIIFPDIKTEQDFYRKYPTISHLKKDFLIQIDNQYTRDIRCLYLVIHHYYKARGHFLLSSDLSLQNEEMNKNYFYNLLDSFMTYLSEEWEIEWETNKINDIIKILLVLSDQNEMNSIDVNHSVPKSRGINDKFRDLKKLLIVTNSDNPDISKRQEGILKLILGGTGNLEQIFIDDSLAESEYQKISFAGSKSYENEIRPNMENLLAERIVLLDKIKQIYDYVILHQILKGEQYLSVARVKMYEQYKEDLQLLKKVVKLDKYADKKKLIFSLQDNKINNYVKYTGKKCATCTQEELCQLVQKELFGKVTQIDTLSSEEQKLYQKLETRTLCTKQRNLDNGAIPNQVHVLEMKQILTNCQKLFPFLDDLENEDSVAYKLLKIMTYRIPYFVGPLNGNEASQAQGRYWLERKVGQEKTKITPWNFDQVVDERACAENFINNLTNYCTYLKGEKVLPKASLLYQKYMVLNELNNLRLKSQKPSVAVKQKIFNQLFCHKNKVSRRALIDFYQTEYGEKITPEDISGIDQGFNSSLSTYLALKKDFAELLATPEGEKILEEIITWNTIFGDEKKMLKEKIIAVYGQQLSSEQINKLVSKNFTSWGRLSHKFLTGIYGGVKAENEYHWSGEINLITALWQTNYNLMELLSDHYFSFYQAVEQENKIHNEVHKYDKIDYQLVEEMYVSPAVKRAIWQALQIVKEIVTLMGQPPKKIFIESTRDATSAQKGQRSINRRAQIEIFYQGIRDDLGQMKQLKITLDQVSDEKLKGKRFFLYFMQMGKCMYTGKPIDFDKLDNHNFYDIEHIYPRSVTKDDSLNNLVLSDATVNRKKKDKYLCEVDDGVIQKNMKAQWNYFFKVGLLSKEKYYRLTRTTPLSESELASFINRQLVETSQANKEVKNVLINLFSKQTRVVFSKSGLVSDFRQEFNLYKCRAVNNFHHAHDAYLNIVVGNAYNTKFTDNPYNFIKNHIRGSYSLKTDVLWRNFDIKKGEQVVWSKAGREGLSFDQYKKVKYDESQDQGTIQIVRQVLRQPDILMTRKVRTGHDLLSKVTILPAGQGSIGVKKDLSIAKYGGYTNSGTAYFCIVEQEKIKNNKAEKIKTIETITVMERQKYEADPKAYFQGRGYQKVRIIVPCVKINALFKIGRAYVNLVGKTGDSYIFNVASELYIDQEQTRYLRYLERFLDLSKKVKNLTLPSNTMVTSAKNLVLYDFFLSKFEASVYKDVFTSTWKNYVAQGREKFISLSLEEQIKVLMQILQFFTCNAVIPDLSLIKGKASRIVIAKDITNKKIKLIQQSITGLWQNSLIV